MKRCYFAPVAGIIRENFQEGCFDSRSEFAETLFESYLNGSEKTFDISLTNKWMRGTAKLSPDLCGYYRNSQTHREDLAVTLEDAIFPSLSDVAMVVRKVHELLIGDDTVSGEKKRELCASYPFETNAKKAAFLADVIIFAMNRPFEPSVKSGIRQPVSEGCFPNLPVPNPCPHFCGRDDEIADLRKELLEKKKVFLCGVPGIGKSELAKAYAKAHKSDYANILYLPCADSLKGAVARQTSVDDLPYESEEGRFQKHDAFLRTLKSDSLLIIDNCNSVARDRFLPDLLQYPCRILITTRCNPPERNRFLLKEFRKDEDLFKLASCFYSDIEKDRPLVMDMIEDVHRHTVAVELAAKLMDKGLSQPDATLFGFQMKGTASSRTDRLVMVKDGRIREASYFEHIRELFSLSELTPSEREIMRCMTLVPMYGISARLFGEILRMRDANELWGLTERGYLQSEPGNKISLYPVMREVAAFELPPGVKKCEPFLRGIRREMGRTGFDDWDVLFETAENIAEFAVNDDGEILCSFLWETFRRMEEREYVSGMAHLLSFLKRLANEETVPNPSELDWIMKKAEQYEKRFEHEMSSNWKFYHILHLMRAWVRPDSSFDQKSSLKFLRTCH